jgi:hypothetical protein
MATEAKKRKLTQEHKDKISAAHTKRRKTKAAQRANHAKPGPQKPARRRRAVKNGRAPEGIHVLRRNGGGKDLVECNANEVMEAVRILRKIKELVCKT